LAPFFKNEFFSPLHLPHKPANKLVLSIVAALYEMRMQLSDDGGVLQDWKDNQMTPCGWANIDCQDNKVIAM
jgi:hypothetical protein